MSVALVSLDVCGWLVQWGCTEHWAWAALQLWPFMFVLVPRRMLEEIASSGSSARVTPVKNKNMGR